MFNALLSLDQQYTMLIVMGVLLVGMLAMSIIPQRKRQKETQKMMDSLHVGTKVKTIGGFIGEIVSMDMATNTMVIDISAKGDKSACVTIDRNAVYTTMSVNAAGQTVEPQKEQALDDVAPTSTVKDEPVIKSNEKLD